MLLATHARTFPWGKICLFGRSGKIEEGGLEFNFAIQIAT